MGRRGEGNRREGARGVRREEGRRGGERGGRGGWEVGEGKGRGTREMGDVVPKRKRFEEVVVHKWS